jgi:transcriptional regulator with XRE-family HTH domain
MLNIGEKISSLRKRAKLSQTDLAKITGASRTIIGNYERNENTPSTDMIVKLAAAFDVSVDYLLGEGEIAKFDKSVLKRMNDIENLDSETRDKLYFLIDNVVQNYKAKKAYAG